jgi:hypothetical protein
MVALLSLPGSLQIREMRELEIIMNTPNTNNAYIGNAHDAAPQGQKTEAAQVKPDLRKPDPKETAQEPQHQVTPRDVPLKPATDQTESVKSEKPSITVPLQAAKGDDELMSKPAAKS